MTITDPAKLHSLELSWTTVVQLDHWSHYVITGRYTQPHHAANKGVQKAAQTLYREYW